MMDQFSKSLYDLQQLLTYKNEGLEFIFT
jgi:hypothetical protein